VLFVDEAYSLVSERGDDAYGTEAVAALLKRVEDDRDRLVVILAGYPEPMDRLLKSNPGLSSRFSRQMNFPDYTATELGQIMQAMTERDHYKLPADTRSRLLVGFQFLVDNRDEHFGNGRLVRNVFETAVRRLSSRIAGQTPLTRELLTVLHPEDIVMPGVADSVWEKLRAAEYRFEFVCPGCQQKLRAQARTLGRRVSCRHCQHRFTTDWGTPVLKRHDR
jgi:hypothetical protein